MLNGVVKKYTQQETFNNRNTNVSHETFVSIQDGNLYTDDGKPKNIRKEVNKLCRESKQPLKTEFQHSSTMI